MLVLSSMANPLKKKEHPMQEVYIVRDKEGGYIVGVYTTQRIAERCTYRNSLGYLPCEREEAIYEGEELTEEDRATILANVDIDRFEVEG